MANDFKLDHLLDALARNDGRVTLRGARYADEIGKVWELSGSLREGMTLSVVFANGLRMQGPPSLFRGAPKEGLPPRPAEEE